MVKAPAMTVTAALLAMLGAAAIAQEPVPQVFKVPPFAREALAPTNIALLPPVSQAVLSRDIKGVYSELERQRDSVNARVLAKDGERAGFTPLILAAAISDPEIAQVLIKSGAAITALDDYHRSAFWYAALRDDVTLTDVLAGAPGSKEIVNAADDDLQRTPLHIAVRGGEPKLVQYLLNIGATRDSRDILGETPVEFCKRRATEACQALN